MFLSQNIWAFHSAGAEMRYKYLGKDNLANDKYEITIVFWRDCSNNGPNAAQLDPQITVFFFQILPKIEYSNIAGSGFKTVKLSKHIKKDSINLYKGYSCINLPPSICLEIGEYTFEQSFPPRTGGYYVGWQRCCRNAAISNIVNPVEIGITYLCKIPGKEVEKRNNSVVFSKPVFPFVCLGMETTFDLSTTDVDGDSLVYKFVEPSSGLDKNGVGVASGNGRTEVNIGNKMGIPPILPVKFKPDYSAENPFGKGSKVELDSQTGELKVMAASEGLHSMAILVEEWRNGAKINENTRDFQTWVIKCKSKEVSNIVIETPTSDNPDLVKLNWFYVTQNVPFEFDVEIKGDINIKPDSFLVYPIGLLADTSQFKLSIKSKNPYIIHVKGEIHDRYPNDSTLLSFVVEKISDCIITPFPIMFTQYVKVKPNGRNPNPDFPLKQVVIYPNPNNGQFYINWDSDVTGLTTFSIADLTGRIKYKTQVQSQRGKNELEFIPEKMGYQLSSGMYILRTSTSYGYTISKIVVQ